jgi:prophage regulatory protein
MSKESMRSARMVRRSGRRRSIGQDGSEATPQLAMQFDFAPVGRLSAIAPKRPVSVPAITQEPDKPGLSEGLRKPGVSMSPEPPMAKVAGNRELPDAILRLPAVKARTGLGRSTIYARMDAGTFPAQITLGPKSVGWSESEIDAWVQQAKLGREQGG